MWTIYEIVRASNHLLMPHRSAVFSVFRICCLWDSKNLIQSMSFRAAPIQICDVIHRTISILRSVLLKPTSVFMKLIFRCTTRFIQFFPNYSELRTLCLPKLDPAT